MYSMFSSNTRANLLNVKSLLQVEFLRNNVGVKLLKCFQKASQVCPV